jgi:hypothetical protein
MQWDIKMGREQDFSEFVVREFAPRLMQLGIEPSEVLYTMYGDGQRLEKASRKTSFLCDKLQPEGGHR